MDSLTLHAQNQAYQGTHGVSHNNSDLGFKPAFLNKATGDIEISVLKDGSPCPMHLISWLPGEWASEVDREGAVTQLKGYIIAGFVRDGVFYTRAEAAEL